MNKKRLRLPLFLVLALSVPALAQASFDYTPMEQIPGFTTSGDFCTYISAVYKFGIWTVGIAAMLMIIIGGYMYVMSAGNQAGMGKAKGIITDALIGLVLALSSYLILYEINPNLLNCSIAGGGTTTTATTTTTTTTAATGTCASLTTGPCSVDNLKASCFGSSNAENASKICNAESGGKETLNNSVDKCQPGNEVVSFGLFQINISANNIGSLNCPNAFSSMYTGSNKNCTIKDQSLYNQCATSAKTSSSNISAACSISNNGTKWSPWSTHTKCGL